MENQMSFEQAFQFIDEMLATIAAPRQQHVNMQVALRVIASTRATQIEEIERLLKEIEQLREGENEDAPVYRKE